MYSGTSAGAAAVGVAMLELMAELEAEAREGTPRSAPVSGAVSPAAAAAGFSPRGDGRIRSRGFNIYKRPNPASAQVPGAPAPCHSHVLALYPH